MGLTYTLAGVANFNFTGNQRATLLMQISNPTGSDFPFINTEISGNVILNDVAVLGNAFVKLNNYLASGQSIVVPVDFEITNPTITGGVVAAAALLTQKGVNLDFDGQINVSGISYPLHLNYVVK